MADIEKVIIELKWFRDRDTWREGIMVYDDHAEVRKRICDDAIEILKEQQKEFEPIKPLDVDDDFTWLCGNCKEELFFGETIRDKYCSECGKKIKWE